MKTKEIVPSRFATKMINPKYYGVVRIKGENNITGENFDQSNIIWIPTDKMPITTKISVSDENGTRTVWQISRWQRIKYWLKNLYYLIKNK